MFYCFLVCFYGDFAISRVQDRRRPLTEEEVLDLLNNLSEIEDLSDYSGDNFEQEGNDTGSGEPFLIEKHNDTNKEQDNPKIDIEPKPEVMDVVDQEWLHNFEDLTAKKDIRWRNKGLAYITSIKWYKSNSQPVQK